jgi:hypothetical protein
MHRGLAACRTVEQAASVKKYGLGQLGWDDTAPEYEPHEGRVVLSRYMDEAVRQAIMVRAGIEEEATREAVVEELRRLGYTVIPPS